MATKRELSKSDREMALAHKYRVVSGGQPVVNVTAISELIDDGKAGAMAGAAAKLTREGFNYRNEWRAKADRGSRIHAHCESFMRGEEIDQLEDEAGYIDALDKWMVENDPELIMQEVIVLSSHGYGGRFDLLAKFGAGEHEGQVGLVDLKSGSRYPVNHTWQLALYRFADGTAVYDDAGKLERIVPLPPIDFCACLYVREDGTYSFPEYPADRTAWEIALKLLDVHQFVRAPHMKALVKEARDEAAAAKTTITEEADNG